MKGIRKVSFIVYILIIGLFVAGCTPRVVDIAHKNNNNVIDYTKYEYQRKTGDKEIYMSIDGGKLTIEDLGGIKDDEKRININIEGKEYRVYGNKNQFTVDYPDGSKGNMRYNEGSGGVSNYSGSGFDKIPTPKDFREIAFGTNKNDKGSFVGILISLLFFFGGLLAFKNPDFAWKLSEGWKYRDVEPSDIYLFLSMAIGMLFMIGSGLYILISIIW